MPIPGDREPIIYPPGHATVSNFYVGGTSNGPGGTGLLIVSSYLADIDRHGGHDLYTVVGTLSCYGGGQLNAKGLTIDGTCAIGGDSTFTIGTDGLTLAGPYSPLFALGGIAGSPDSIVLDGPLIFNGSNRNRAGQRFASNRRCTES